MGWGREALKSWLELFSELQGRGRSEGLSPAEMQPPSGSKGRPLLPGALPAAASCCILGVPECLGLPVSSGADLPQRNPVWERGLPFS